MNLVSINSYFERVVKKQKCIPGIGLMPQSMTTAPGLIQSPLTNSGWPIPTTKISA